MHVFNTLLFVIVSILSFVLASPLHLRRSSSHGVAAHMYIRQSASARRALVEAVKRRPSTTVTEDDSAEGRGLENLGARALGANVEQGTTTKTEEARGLTNISGTVDDPANNLAEGIDVDNDGDLEVRWCHDE